MSNYFSQFEMLQKKMIFPVSKLTKNEKVKKKSEKFLVQKVTFLSLKMLQKRAFPVSKLTKKWLNLSTITFKK